MSPVQCVRDVTGPYQRPGTPPPPSFPCKTLKINKLGTIFRETKANKNHFAPESAGGPGLDSEMWERAFRDFSSLQSPATPCHVARHEPFCTALRARISEPKLQGSRSPRAGSARTFASNSGQHKENRMKLRKLYAVVFGSFVVLVMSLSITAQQTTQSTTTTTQTPDQPVTQTTQTTESKTKYKHHHRKVTKEKQKTTTTTIPAPEQQTQTTTTTTGPQQ